MILFHSHENTKTCTFTVVKIQDLIFSREKNRKIGTTFFCSQYGLRDATLYGIYVSFLREATIGVSYFYGNVNKKPESLRSSKERAFINLSAITRKSKQKLM